jgi:hypothetical protein
LQEGLLFHSLYDGDSSTYTEQFVCGMSRLDTQAFERSWNILISRHSILRTGFYFDSFNIPVQCVYRKVRMPFKILDYRSMTGEFRAEAIDAFKKTDRQEPFNVREAPLMRSSLLRVSEDQYCMLWTYHHLIMDGWSMQVLMKEFLEVYESLVLGNPLPEAEEDRYEDYIRYIERNGKPKEEAFWRSYMEGLQEGSLLPFVSPSVDRNKGVEPYCGYDLLLDEAVTRQLQAYAQQQHITVNTVIQGVWSCLLHKYTNSDHITYGVTVSGRPEDMAGVEQRIGLYINMIPLHSDWDPTLNVADWLRNLQQKQQRSRRFQYTSINDIQRWIGIQGDLFDTSLTFQNFPLSEVVAAQEWQLQIDSIEINEQTTNYPLSIRAILGASTVIQFIYKPSVLDEVTIKSISRHFEQVILRIIGGNELQLSNLSLLSEKEEHLVASAGKGIHLDIPASQTVLHLLAEQVRTAPGATAIEFGDYTLSYKELDEQSNQLARFIQQQGSAHQMIPVCLGRSPEFIIAIAGVLKAGGAYVPIDPLYPAERIACRSGYQ